MVKDKVTFMEPIEEDDQGESTKTEQGENCKPDEEMIKSKVTAEVEPAEKLTEETLDDHDVDILVEETQKEENMKPDEEMIESKVTAEVEPAEKLTEETLDDHGVDVLVEETGKEENLKPK